MPCKVSILMVTVFPHQKLVYQKYIRGVTLLLKSSKCAKIDCRTMQVNFFKSDTLSIFM